MPTKNTNAEAYTLHVQSSAHIISFNQERRITGISETLLKEIPDPATVLGTSLEVYLASQFQVPEELSQSLQVLDQDVVPGRIFLVKKDHCVFYLHIYTCENQWYLKWEKKLDEVIFTTAISEFNSQIDKLSGRLWPCLSEVVQQIAGFDHCAVVQVHDDRSSSVIYASPNAATTLDGRQFSSDFIPSKLLSYLVDKEHSYLPDVEYPAQAFFTVDRSIQLPPQVLPLPNKPIFSHYVGAASILAVPVIIDEVLWGIVLVWNTSKKKN